MTECDFIALVLLIYLSPAFKQDLMAFLVVHCLFFHLLAFLEQDADQLSVLHAAGNSAAIVAHW